MAGTSKKVKYASIYYGDNGDKKIAEMQQNTYEFDTGDGQEMTDEGPQFTDGITTAKVTCKALMPVKGMSVPIFADAINKRTIIIRVGLVDGHIHTMEARLKSGKVDSEVQSGKQTGDFEWMCHNITIT